jgi:hypothetical protein
LLKSTLNSCHVSLLSITLYYFIKSGRYVVDTLISVLGITKYSQLFFCLFNRCLKLLDIRGSSLL